MKMPDEDDSNRQGPRDEPEAASAPPGGTEQRIMPIDDGIDGHSQSLQAAPFILDGQRLGMTPGQFVLPGQPVLVGQQLQQLQLRGIDQQGLHLMAQLNTQLTPEQRTFVLENHAKSQRRAAAYQDKALDLQFESFRANAADRVDVRKDALTRFKWQLVSGFGCLLVVAGLIIAMLLTGRTEHLGTVLGIAGRVRERDPHLSTIASRDRYLTRL
jgi:hypothetical protein